MVCWDHADDARVRVFCVSVACLLRVCDVCVCVCLCVCACAHVNVRVRVCTRVRECVWHDRRVVCRDHAHDAWVR